MNAEIILKAQALGLTKAKIESEVQIFLDAQGEDLTDRALDMADASMRKISRTGMNPGTGLRNWRWATRKVLGDIDRHTIQSRLDEEKAASEAAYKATIKKGYTPNRETLLAQIEALYEEGEISSRQYDSGMVGLNTVFGYVEAAKELTEDEAAMEEFGF